MIIAQIRGGLGNQMFVFASAYSVARKNNTRLVIDKSIYDTSYFLRKYELNKFSNIKNELLIKMTPGNNIFKIYLYKIIRYFKINILYHAKYVLEEKEFEYQDINVNNKNIYMVGYWQDYLYFNKYKNELIQMFKPSREFYEKYGQILIKIKSEESVAIHIRRSDYMNFNGGSCMSLTYYRDAIKFFKNLYKNARFYIFTDNVEFVKKNFLITDEVSIISDMINITDLDELYLMSNCCNYIIANSSFSWWAAYLGEKDTSIVIAPIVGMWKKKYYPEHWKTINAEFDK